ncbi:MAG: Toxin co-regulated pilus biosynthesis protein Q [Firmicutes bacterium ADurb.Bin419]|nr:MAG: Toxin co-regulated pilus biosynthesis protein Q [Firmicutes bacterium ADurb.Bin419]
MGKPPVPTSPSREYAAKYPGAIDYYNQNPGTMPGNQNTGVTPSFEPIDDWMAPEGASLRSLLQDWADKSGWRVVWNTDREYILEAGAMFRGRYSDVSAALLRAFARATPAPMGVFYKGNKVLVVHTQEAENAD